MAIKNSNDTNRNRTRDLPACSTVPQLTAPQFDRLPSEFQAEALPFERNVFGFIA